MKDVERLFEIKFNFFSHPIYKLDKKSGLPQTYTCNKDDHSGCRVGDYLKGNIEEIYKDKIVVKDYKIEKSVDAKRNGLPVKKSTITVLVSAENYERPKLRRDLKELLENCDRTFGVEGKSNLESFFIQRRNSNYTLY